MQDRFVRSSCMRCWLAVERQGLGSTRMLAQRPMPRRGCSIDCRLPACVSSSSALDSIARMLSRVGNTMPTAKASNLEQAQGDRSSRLASSDQRQRRLARDEAFALHSCAISIRHSVRSRTCAERQGEGGRLLPSWCSNIVGLSSI